MLDEARVVLIKICIVIIHYNRKTVICIPTSSIPPYEIVRYFDENEKRKMQGDKGRVASIWIGNGQFSKVREYPNLFGHSVNAARRT